MITFEQWYSDLIEDDDFLVLDKTSLCVGFNAGLDAAKPRWIPVTERLPDDWEEKIVRYGKYEFFYASYQLSDGGTNGRKKGNWYTLTDDSPMKVTHWMPVPDILE